jgi:hypothetical protein
VHVGLLTALLADEDKGLVVALVPALGVHHRQPNEPTRGELGDPPAAFE